GARRIDRGHRGRRAHVCREHAAQPHLLAVRRGPDHRGAVRWARGACRPVSQLQDGGPGRAGPRGDRVAPLYTPPVFRVRLAIAAALPAFAWILPAPGGALATALVALGLTLTPGAGPGSTAGWSTPGWRPGFVTFRTALVSAAPFWLFLLLLHDVPTMVRMG